MDQAEANQAAVQLFQRFSDRYGLLLSMIEQFPMNSAQNAIPLYTYPAFEYLQQFDFSSENVFGYSCNCSAIWWATVAKYTYTIEINESVHVFIQKQARRLKKLQSILVWKEDIESFRQAIRYAETPPDIVTINLPEPLLSPVLDYLAEQITADRISPKLIVVNNSAMTADSLKVLGCLERYLQVDFHGLGPVFNYTWTTSLFLNTTDRLKGYRMIPSLAAING